MNASLERKTQHLQARKFLSQGLYPEAEAILLEGLRQLGPHVGLLSDLVVLYYQQGKIDQFEKYFKTLQDEFAVSEKKLSADSLIKTSIILAKFHEEMGSLEKALACCNRAIEVSEKLEDKKKIQIQKLRLVATLGPSSELSEIYALCNRIKGYSPHLQIELLHGLMLAEIHLLGFKAGNQRLHQALGLLNSGDQKGQVVGTSKEILMDRCLLIADYLEQELLVYQKTKLPTEVLHVLTDGDVFEQCLLSLAHKNFHVLSEVQDQLTKMSWFRLAAICLRLMPEEEGQELERKFRLLLGSVPASSYKLLSQKWSFLWKLQEHHEITLENEKALYLGRELLFGRKNNLKTTLRFFSENSDASLEDFVSKALGENYDLYSFDQVRMIFSRIQKDFTKNLGILFPVFHTSKNRVWKSENVRIRRV